MPSLSKLERTIGSFLAVRPERRREPDRARQDRREAKRLISEHGFPMERLSAAPADFLLYPHSDFHDADPFEGDHHAGSWEEALYRLQVYLGLRTPKDVCRVPPSGHPGDTA